MTSVSSYHVWKKPIEQCFIEISKYTLRIWKCCGILSACSCANDKELYHVWKVGKTVVDWWLKLVFQQFIWEDPTVLKALSNIYSAWWTCRPYFSVNLWLGHLLGVLTDTCVLFVCFRQRCGTIWWRRAGAEQEPQVWWLLHLPILQKSKSCWEVKSRCYCRLCERRPAVTEGRSQTSNLICSIWRLM